MPYSVKNSTISIECGRIVAGKYAQGDLMTRTAKKRYAAIIVAMSAFFVLTGCSDEKKAPVASNEVQALKVESVTVRKEKIPIWIQYTATTKASSEQEVRARVPGRLEKVFFKDGDMVKKGDKLFLIEQGPYKSALKAAEAEKERDEASLKLATANVERYKPLVHEGLAPRAKLEEYEAQQARFKAALTADEAKIEDAARKLEYTVVRAPISGKISARHVDAGNLVGFDGPTLLTTIVQTNPLYAYFSPSESDVAKIRHYASKQRLDAIARVASADDILERSRLDGYVDFSDNSVDPQTSTVTMRATLNNPKGYVLPGTFVYLDIFVTDKHEFIVIPPQSIFEDQRGKFVYTVGEDGKAKRRSITIGLSNRYFTQIEKGLEDGDRVLVTGLAKVHPGAKLEVIDATDTKGAAAIIKKNKLIPQTDN